LPKVTTLKERKGLKKISSRAYVAHYDANSVSRSP
jgi:hypothetical protein